MMHDAMIDKGGVEQHCDRRFLTAIACGWIFFEYQAVKRVRRRATFNVQRSTAGRRERELHIYIPVPQGLVGSEQVAPYKLG